MTSVARAFGVGFVSPFHGLKLMATNRKIGRLGFLPIVATAIVFIAGFILGASSLSPLIVWFAQSVATIFFTGGTVAAVTLYWISMILLWPAAVFALAYLLFALSRVMASPLYALLAERVLIETGLMQEHPFNFGEWVALSIRLLMVSLGKLFIFAVVGGVLLVFSIIPGFAVVTAFGFLLMTAFDVVDMSFEALRLGLKERFRIFRQAFPAFAGLACALGLVFLIPGLNFFLLPAAVVGGCEIIRHHKLSVGEALK